MDKDLNMGRYLGNDVYEIRFTSGKEIILNEAEIKELSYDYNELFKSDVLYDLSELSNEIEEIEKSLKIIKEDIEDGYFGTEILLGAHEEISNKINDLQKSVDNIETGIVSYE